MLRGRTSGVMGGRLVERTLAYWVTAFELADGAHLGPVPGHLLEMLFCVLGMSWLAARLSTGVWAIWVSRVCQFSKSPLLSR